MNENVEHTIVSSLAISAVHQIFSLSSNNKDKMVCACNMHIDKINVQNLSETIRAHVIDTGNNGRETNKNYFKYIGI